MTDPNMRWLREELASKNIDFEVDDSDEFEDDVSTHVEQTILDGIEVRYAWYRDYDDRKRGVSVGWPAFLECQIGDHEPFAATVDEIVSLL